MAVIDEADDWKGLKDTVREQGDVATVSMHVLRDLVGVGRLGKHVNAQASSEMAKVGLGHFPISTDEWPVNQWARIRIFVRGGRVEQLYESMLRISDDSRVAETDDALISSIARDDAAEILQRVKALVCE